MADADMAASWKDAEKMLTKEKPKEHFNCCERNLMKKYNTSWQSDFLQAEVGWANISS